MALSSVEITIRAIDQASAVVNRVYDSVKQLGNAQNNVQRLGKNLSNLGQGMTKTATLPIAAGLGVATKLAVDFESSMAEVQKAANLDSAGMASMSQQILNMSKTMPVAATELAEITAAGAKLGISGEENLEGFTRQISAMSVAFDMAAGEAADSAANIANVYKMQDASGNLDLGQMERFGNVVNAIGDNMSTTEAQVISATKAMSGTAASMGITAEETAALGAGFTALGVQPGVAANAFKVGMGRMGNATGQVREGMEALGINVEQFQKQVSQGQGAQAFADAMDTINKSALGPIEKADAISKVFGNNYNDVISQAAQGSDAFAQAFDLMGKSMSGQASTMADSFDIMANTTAGQMQKFKNNLVALAIPIGNAILPAINGIIEGISPLVSGMANFAAQHPGITKIAVGFLAVVAAIGPVLVAIGSVVGAVGTLMAAFSAGGALAGLGAAIAGVAAAFLPAVVAAAPFIAAIAAIAAAAYLIITNWGPISTFFSNLWAMLTADIARVSTGIANFVMGIINMGMTIMNSVAQFFGFQNALSMVGSAVMAAVQPFHLLKNLIMQVGPAALQAAMQMVQGFVQGGSQVVAAVTSMGQQVLGRIRAIAGQAFSAGAQIIQRLAAGIMSGVGAVTSAIGNVANAIKSALPGSPVKEGVLRVLNNPATGPGAKISEMIAAGISAGAPAVQSAMGGLGSGIVGGGPTGGGGQSIPATSPFAGGGGGVSIGSITFSFPGINSQEEAQAVGDDFEDRLEQALQRVLSNQNRIAYS